MRNSVYAVLLMLICSCGTEHYEGYVYYKDEPLKDVFVKEKDGNIFSVQTNNKGYFKLEKTVAAGALIFSKDGFVKNTVTFGGSEPESTLFLRAASDTLRLEKEKLQFDTEGSIEFEVEK